MSELHRTLPHEAFTDVELVPLQTDARSLVGHIEQIYIQGERICVCDVNQNLLCFALDGSFLFKLSPGRGHGEYSDLTHCYVSSERIFVYDYLQSRMYIYDWNGHFINSVQSDANSVMACSPEGVMMPGGQILVNLDFVPGIRHYYGIIDTGPPMSLRAELCRYPFVWKYRSSDGSRPKIAQNSNGVHVLSIMSDTVYTVDVKSNRLVAQYIFDSGKKSVCQSGLSAEQGDELLHLALSNDDYSPGLRSLIMTDDVGYALCRYDGEYCNLFWNLDNGRGYIFPQIKGHPSALQDLDLLTATADRFVGVVYPYKLPPDSELRALAGIADESNPIVVLYKKEHFYAD